MEFQDGLLRVESFLAVTLAIIVLFVGKRLNQKVGFLRDFSIPEPVTGGLLFSVLFGLLYLGSGLEIEFELQARNILLIYFFTTIGINASARELLAGGLPLLLLLTITVTFMVVQNLTGISVAMLFDLPAAVGVIGGTVSLIGGHGTTIAWAPGIAETYDIPNAMEIGIASATFGLILASIMGGPIAKFLISRHQLLPSEPENTTVETVQAASLSDKQKATPVNYLDFLGAILAIHICIVIGFALNEVFANLGLKLPLFVTCLFAGMLITNLVPRNFPSFTGNPWPTRSPAITLIADISLGTFLALSLMSMQLWTLADLAGPIAAILAAQFTLVMVVTIFILFPLMGKNYDAAVIAAGFGGVTLGSTPTAMANMAAVTQRFGPSRHAFIIVPLVSAFFIDLVNALLIPYFLQTF